MFAEGYKKGNSWRSGGDVLTIGGERGRRTEEDNDKMKFIFLKWHHVDSYIKVLEPKNTKSQQQTKTQKIVGSSVIGVGGLLVGIWNLILKFLHCIVVGFQSKGGG